MHLQTLSHHQLRVRILYYYVTPTYVDDGRQNERPMTHVTCCSKWSCLYNTKLSQVVRYSGSNLGKTLVQRLPYAAAMKQMKMKARTQVRTNRECIFQVRCGCRDGIRTDSLPQYFFDRPRSNLKYSTRFHEIKSSTLAFTQTPPFECIYQQITSVLICLQLEMFSNSIFWPRYDHFSIVDFGWLWIMVWNFSTLTSY